MLISVFGDFIILSIFMLYLINFFFVFIIIFIAWPHKAEVGLHKFPLSNNSLNPDSRSTKIIQKKSIFNITFRHIASVEVYTCVTSSSDLAEKNLIFLQNCVNLQCGVRFIDLLIDKFNVLQIKKLIWRK